MNRVDKSAAHRDGLTAGRAGASVACRHADAPRACPQAHARAHASRYYLLTTVADWITIGFCGTSLIGPRVVVGVASMRLTTSMPLVTLPNTA